jgi:hypothetical protein
MATFFPKNTGELRLREPKAFRRFSYSLVEMAIVTGVLVRLYRVVILTHGSNNWLYLGVTFTLGTVFLLGMATAHLASFPLQQYLWRAPAFALIEVGAEMATSALLIALGREPNGTVRAHWDDWFGLARNALLIRGLSIIVWGLVLGAVVYLVRRTIVHEDKEPNGAPAS